jgi:uncharacterized tellurite resistance protein B-like protein
MRREAMPAAMKRWFDSLDSDQTFKPKNPEKFKRATASIICSIINFNDVKERDELCKFCDLFKAEFHIDEERAEKLFKDSTYLKENLEKNAQIIKEELDNDEYKLMEYMKMLNRFIIVDNCKDEDYCIFDELKVLLFD